MTKKKHQKNYDIFSKFDYFVPDVRGLVGLTIWFIVGALLGSVVTAVLTAILGDIENMTSYVMLVAYPVMFIPPMMYASLKSNENSFFGKGVKLSSDNYKPLGGAFCVLLVMVATLCGSFIADGVGCLLPDMPEWLENVLESMTQGKLWADFLCVSIFAPIFEEWLCRGMVLRGLLNYERRNSNGEKVKGIRPVWAIIISAVFFAVIHGNPWQAVTAFLLGCLFGYVYYRTGSIKLTMLMHFTNNTFALILSNIDKISEAENWLEIVSPVMFTAIMLFSAAFIWYFYKKFETISLQRPQGNCDEFGE